jgi:hypothetical protein
MATAQHDAPAPTVKTFDDHPCDGIGGHQCLSGVDPDPFHAYSAQLRFLGVLGLGD